ncbi:6370_t:CDS:2, partial [Dentiscutata heterogama]
MTDDNSDLETLHSKRPNLGIYRTLPLAFKALGVVYGDIGAAPMFVFNGMFLDQPNEDDVY